MAYVEKYQSYIVIARIFKWISCVVIGLGVIIAVAGVMSDPLQGLIPSQSVAFSVRLIAAEPGIEIAILGVLLLVLALWFRASVDTAEMTREMLFIVREDPGSLLQRRQEARKSTQPSESTDLQPIEPVERYPGMLRYKGFYIRFSDNEAALREKGTSTVDKIFKSKEEAIKYINEELLKQ